MKNAVAKMAAYEKRLKDLISKAEDHAEEYCLEFSLQTSDGQSINFDGDWDNSTDTYEESWDTSDGWNSSGC